MKHIFYDLFHSPEDNGWYADVFRVTVEGTAVKNSVDLITTNITKTRTETVKQVKQQYPTAKLCKEFN